MSLTTNTSQGPINHFANALVQLLQNQVPALARGAIVTAVIIERVRDLVRKHIKLLGSALLTTGLLTIFPSLLVTAVHALGFTAGGVLKGSIAALIQSIFFGAQTGGWFSVLQAFGATAVVSPPIAIGLGVTLTLVGAGILGYQLWKRHSERRRVDQNGGNSDDDDSNPHRRKSTSLQVTKSPRQPSFWDFFRSRR